MSVLAERPRHFESEPPKELAGKARELWGLIAPEREPSFNSTAISDFELVSSGGIEAETQEQKELIDHLRVYRASHDGFLALLKINEFQERRRPFSFKFKIIASTNYEIVDTPSRNPETVFLIREYPREAGLRGLFLPYSVEIVKGNQQLVGPKAWEKVRPLGFSSHNMEWRRKFAAGALEMLIRVVQRQPREKRVEIDKEFCKSMQKHGDPLRDLT